MAFNSISYFLFLPLVFLFFYVTAERWRWLVLLTASYYYYNTFMAPYLLAVLLLITVISYICGLHIYSQQHEAGRKQWLWIGVIACLAILVFLKYLPFLKPCTSSIFGLNSALSSLLVSIGVSYYSFQAISYLADVYLEIEKPERHFGYYALYLAFFPKMLQGPIERAGDLLPQLKKIYQFDYNAVRSGMLLLTWGLFKKVVVADRLALYADPVYNNVHDYTGLPLIIGTYAYALQIYFDFSAYTDMARGTGQMFGINLTENFNSPYMAISVSDFWRRWHISFSRWILDYIFKPLQMCWRDLGKVGTAAALIITFIVSGIWHGATWGFAVWGLLHGIYLAASIYYQPYKKRLHKWLGVEKSRWFKWLQIFVVFNLVSFAWIFFRANSLPDALYVIMNLLSQSQISTLQFLSINGSRDLVVLLLALFVCVFGTKYNFILNTKYRWLLYYIIIISILITGKFNDGKFLYGAY